MTNRGTASILRLSLLTSLGLAAYACGGESASSSPEPSAGASGSTGTTAGTSNGTSGANGIGGGPDGSGGGGGDGQMVATCTDSTPTKGNLSLCAEGYAHRPKATACKVVKTAAGGAGGESGVGDEAGAGGDATLPRADGTVDCYQNESLCDAFQFGYCNNYVSAAAGHWNCLSGCEVDADCGDGQMCICDGPSPSGGICVGRGCSTDADCGLGLLCASTAVTSCSYSVSRPNYTAFSCQSPQDKCATNDDCPGSPGCTGGEDGRYCAVSVGICGRPFLVEAQARVAPVTCSPAWQSALLAQLQLEHLSSAARSELAQHWTKLGQMEHASIAAFARFSLQLLSLGAPPELVEACTQALADETAHTKLCFGIASAYAGRAIGPGPLDVSNSLDVSSLVDIVDLVLAEGCFGETSAALEALEAAEAATDPVIIAAYQQIARDEQRHAELAFRFVRWALNRGGRAVSDRIEAALQSDLTRTHAARSVAVPCLSALVGSARAA